MGRPRVKATALLVGIPAFAVLLLLLLVLVAALCRTPRELILLKNGRPMANLSGDMLSSNAGNPSIVKITTDAEGRLDLSGVPNGTDMIRVTLKNDAEVVFNGDLAIPLHGSRTIDFRGNTTISTTRTRVFGLFESASTSREVWTRLDEPDDAAKMERGQADSGDTAR